MTIRSSYRLILLCVFACSTSTDDQFGKAKKLFDRGSYSESLEQLNQILLNDSSNLNALRLRAECKRELRLFSESLDDFYNYYYATYDTSIVDDIAASEALAIYYVADNSEILKKIEYSPTQIDPYLKFSRQLIASGYIDSALVVLNITLKIAPRDCRILNELGIVLGSLEQYEAALSRYTEAILNCPESYILYGNRGIEKARFGDYQGAIIDLKKSLRLNTNYCESYINLITVFENLNMLDSMGYYRTIAQLGGCDIQ